MYQIVRFDNIQNYTANMYSLSAKFPTPPFT